MRASSARSAAKQVGSARGTAKQAVPARSAAQLPGSGARCGHGGFTSAIGPRRRGRRRTSGRASGRLPGGGPRFHVPAALGKGRRAYWLQRSRRLGEAGHDPLGDRDPPVCVGQVGPGRRRRDRSLLLSRQGMPRPGTTHSVTRGLRTRRSVQRSDGHASHAVGVLGMARGPGPPGPPASA